MKATTRCARSSDNLLSAPEASLFPSRRREELLVRAGTLRSGRERPGRFWKIDLDALALESLEAAPYAAPQISEVRAGVIACDIATAVARHPELVQRALGTAAALDDSKFGALAAARCNSGAFVYVPADVALDEVLELRYHAAGAALFTYTLVLLERGAHATVIERYTGAEEATLCGVTEIVASAGSNVTCASIQMLPESARAIFTRAAKPATDACVTWCAADLGAALAVNAVDGIIEASGVQMQLNTLFFPTGKQHVDVVSTVEHRAGGSQSETLVKSAANGSGQARFLGNIRIAPNAQSTQASLRDDALLLSERSHIDSIPALEIAANDVKAHHGATVGALDDEQIFYMTSRGLQPQEAERMIALGFFEPVIERFPGAALREELRGILEAKVNR